MEMNDDFMGRSSSTCRRISCCQSWRPSTSRDALGPEHPSTAKKLTYLGVLLRDRGDYIAARPLFERALAISDKALGAEHTTTAWVTGNLARLRLLSGDPSEARALGMRTLAALDKGGTTPRPKMVPASLPTRSTRLAAPKRRRRCGNGMGLRSRRNPKPPETSFSSRANFATSRARPGVLGNETRRGPVVGGWGRTRTPPETKRRNHTQTSSLTLGRGTAWSPK
jgi:hypothetical protein